jgi:hypothetical protein
MSPRVPVTFLPSSVSRTMTVLGLAAGLTTLGVVSLRAAQTPRTQAEVEAFSTALESCSAAKVATPHPFVRTFVIEHTVAGEKDGTCDYRQTMPGKMTLICALSADGRKGLAAEMKAMAGGGPMRGSTSAAPVVWMRECEIETADGTRMPAVSGRGGGAPVR